MAVTQAKPGGAYDDPYWAGQQRQALAAKGINVDQLFAQHPNAALPNLGFNLTAGGGTLQSTNPFADNYQDNTGIFATRFLLDNPNAIDPAMRARWAESYGRTGNTSEFDSELTAERERQWSTGAQAQWDREHAAGYQPAPTIGARVPSMEEALKAGGGHFRAMSSQVPGSAQYNAWATKWQPTGYAGTMATPPTGSRPAGLASVTPAAQGPAAMPAQTAPTGSTDRIRAQQAARGFQGVRRTGIGGGFGQARGAY